MSRRCEMTRRKTRFGGNRKHVRGASGGGGVWRFKAPRTSRTWKPNLRTVKLSINGKVTKMKVSMKGYKKIRKMVEEKPNYSLVK